MEVLLRLQHPFEIGAKVLGIFQANGETEDAVAREGTVGVELRALQGEGVGPDPVRLRWWPRETA